MIYLFYFLLSFLGLIMPLLMSMAYLTLVERKLMAAIQRRKGPNMVGLYGLLQPLADGLKLFVKETIFPSASNLIMFIFSPILTFLLSILAWIFMPMNSYGMLMDVNNEVLCVLAISSLGVYGMMCSGWSSNSKYAFLGALRSTAQMISYEISMGLILITVLMCVGSLNFSQIISFQKTCWFMIPFLPLFLMFYMSILAETNSAPFDLPEAEAELVAGYNTEYSAMGFALFFLGEYANMILMCSLTTIFFLGGFLPPFNMTIFNYIPMSLWFGIKVTLLLTGFMWMRAALPRTRYDQLMFLGWKVLLPIALGFIVFISSFLLFFNGLPY